MARSPDTALREAALERVRAGSPVAEAARSAGVPLSTLYRWMRQEGMSRPSGPSRPGRPPRVPREVIAEAVAEIVSGKSTPTQVAERLGLARTTVDSWIGPEMRKARPKKPPAPTGRRVSVVLRENEWTEAVEVSEKLGWSVSRVFVEAWKLSREAIESMPAPWAPSKPTEVSIPLSFALESIELPRSEPAGEAPPEDPSSGG